MRAALKRQIGNERGATTVMVALMTVALLSLLALGLDVGMLFTAHSEAQRAADAAALAGASEYYDRVPSSTDAEVRARDYAGRNHIQKTLINPGPTAGEVQVNVLHEEWKVRVWVGRKVRTWFASLIGIDNIEVSAIAAAQMINAGSTKCLKPIAIPDLWHDADGDANLNNMWDEGESWIFGSSPSDYYEVFTGNDGIVDSGDNVGKDESGYGGFHRDPGHTTGTPTGELQDYGRMLKIKASDPNSTTLMEPSLFFPWQIPTDSTQQKCDKPGGGTQEEGAATYRQNLCSCNKNAVQLGVDYPLQTGNMVGPTHQGVSELIEEDPNATWDPNKDSDNDGKVGEVVGSSYANWMESPRVVKLALFDPTQITGSGAATIKFNSFALFFIEKQASPSDPVTGRFITYVPGDEAPITSPNTKVLRLVE